MKKNLKIVSAAAAALLAAAPVAASAIPVGAAGITITPGSSSTTTSNTDTKLDLSLSVTNADSLKDGDNVANVQTSLNTNVGQAYQGKNGVGYVLLKSDYDNLKDKSQNSVKNLAATTFQKGKTYVVVAFNVVVSNLNDKVKPPFGETVNPSTENWVDTHALVSKPFTISDTSIPGKPYYSDKDGNIISNASVTLKENTVSELLNEIQKTVSAHGGNSKHENNALSSTNTNDLRHQLSNLGIEVDKKGNFSTPGNNFQITYETTFTNKQKADITIDVTPANSRNAASRTVTKTTPTVTINGNKVVTTNNEINKGATVSTYGSTFVHGTTYYRLNSASSNEFIAASAFAKKTSKPNKSAARKTRRLRLKKNAYIYSYYHKRIGRTVYKKGSAHNVYANNKGAEWYNLSDGTVAYQLSDGRYKNDYIDVRNFGVKVSAPKKTRKARTTYKKARVRSRVFYANGKAVRRTYIGKNTRIRIYGTKRIHGQNYYYLGGRRYVKANNFR